MLNTLNPKDRYVSEDCVLLGSGEGFCHLLDAKPLHRPTVFCQGFREMGQMTYPIENYEDIMMA